MRAIFLAAFCCLFPLVGNAQSANCHIYNSNTIDCDLVSGETVVTAGPAVNIRLTNNHGQWLQINQVKAYTGEKIYWSEYCVFLYDFYIGQRNAPGVGEVACAHKSVGEDYPAIRWGASTGLSTPPGSVVWLSASTHPTYIAHTFSVSVGPQLSGLHSFRAPQIDEAHYGCNQATSWHIWKNAMAVAQHLMGATIYLSGPLSLDRACLYIIRSNGTLKWRMCNAGLNKRGSVSFPTQLIQPNESVAGQAASGFCGGWDWAAYMWVW